MRKIIINLGILFLVIFVFAGGLFLSIPKTVHPTYVNVFGYTSATMRDLFTNQQQILSAPEKTVVVGPLIIVSIDRETKKVTVSPMTSSQNTVDSAIVIDLYYDRSKNDAGWIDAKINTCFFAEGILRKTDLRGLYFDASVIHLAPAE